MIASAIRSTQASHDEQLITKANEIRMVRGHRSISSPSNPPLKRDNQIKALESRKVELENELARALKEKVSSNDCQKGQMSYCSTVSAASSCKGDTLSD